MRRTALAVVAATAVAGGGVALAHDHDGPRPLQAQAWATAFKPPAGVSIEGLTADKRGDLYVAGRSAPPCPVFKVGTGVVGTLPAPCGPAGLAFGPDGRLYVADVDKIMVLRPQAGAPPTAEVYASGVPGANGIAWDQRGDLWVSDGGTGQGRVWRIGADRTPVEMFRVQPMANAAGVGRDARSVPPGSSQAIVANGVAFGRDGTLYVADTARGAIWRVFLDRRGRVLSRTGCDTTFTPDTLCLDDVFVQHPSLEGADGIVLDREDNIYVAANERNAIGVVTRRGEVFELFRNPVAATGLRNEGPLEFPTSPVLTGRRLCLTNSDGGRRDNAPATPGEGPKINCAG